VSRIFYRTIFSVAKTVVVIFSHYPRIDEEKFRCFVGYSPVVYGGFEFITAVAGVQHAAVVRNDGSGPFGSLHC
jgi:hypothetical protein